MLITVDLLRLIFLGLFVLFVVALKIESWRFNRRLKKKLPIETEGEQ